MNSLRFTISSSVNASDLMPEQEVAAIDGAKLARFIGPADRAAIAAEQFGLLQRDDVDALRRIGEGRDKQRVFRTIELAEKAGLAIRLPRDHGNAVGLVEYI